MKLKEIESNIYLNQKFDYYLPKITTKKINSTPIEEILFPGYIFVIKTSSKKLTQLLNTRKE